MTPWKGSRLKLSPGLSLNPNWVLWKGLSLVSGWLKRAEAPSLPEEQKPAGQQEEPAERVELPSLEEMILPEEEPVSAPEQAAPEPSLDELGSFTDFDLEAPAEAPPAEGVGPSGIEESFGPFPEAEPGIPEVGEAAGPLPTEFEAPQGEAEPTPGAAPSEEAAEEPTLEDLGLEDFALPTSVKEFGLPSAQTPAARPQAKRPAPAPPREHVEEIALDITDQQFARLQASLNSLPRNVKMAVEEIIATGMGSAASLKQLIGLLTSGASPAAIATLAGQISGKRLKLPAGFEKKTGIAFEEERHTFGYAFRENILPVVRVFAITAILLGLFLFLGYRYVYEPMYAATNYRVGYDHLQGNRYQLANESFDRATAVWPMKSWFFRYAQGFTDKGEYLLAEQKYEELLSRWPADRQGILDYGRMLSTKVYDYAKADSLFTRLLDVNLFDYDALLSIGDNDMLWASEESTRYDDARLAYATLIQKYGERDELMFRMLRYFIRTDKEVEVEKLREAYGARKDVKVDPQVWAELGGYLIDKNNLDYVQDVLFRAMKVDPSLPEIHYNLARYYRLVNDAGEEKKALVAAIGLLKPTDTLTPQRITLEVDAHTRLGENYDAAQQYLDAEKEYKTAITVLEQNQRRKLVGTGAILAKPYADLGDLSYYQGGDLSAASDLYQKAMDNGLSTPEMTYKLGYIAYAAADYKTALDRFLSSADAQSASRPPDNLLFALGDAFFERKDFYAAQGYYLRLSSTLADRRAGIKDFEPDTQPEHRRLAEYLLQVDNNLGVATFRLSQRTGDRAKRSAALAYLAQATEQYDTLAKTPSSAVRVETQNLPSLNERAILYPSVRIDPQIYALIPKDFEASP